jgi:hypothetical protein
MRRRRKMHAPHRVVWVVRVVLVPTQVRTEGTGGGRRRRADLSPRMAAPVETRIDSISWKKMGAQHAI